jgi:hypothetical protein
VGGPGTGGPDGVTGGFGVCSPQGSLGAEVTPEQ